MSVDLKKAAIKRRILLLGGAALLLAAFFAGWAGYRYVHTKVDLQKLDSVEIRMSILFPDWEPEKRTVVITEPDSFEKVLETDAAVKKKAGVTPGITAQRWKIEWIYHMGDRSVTHYYEGMHNRPEVEEILCGLPEIQAIADEELLRLYREEKENEQRR